MDYLTQAIFLLRPTAQFSFINEDYSTIQWDFIEGKAPTQSEIDAAIEKVKQNELAAKEKAIADKASAQSKLEALGLTADDLKALGL